MMPHWHFASVCVYVVSAAAGGAGGGGVVGGAGVEGSVAHASWIITQFKVDQLKRH